jgi:hypothetical protein
VLDSYDARLLSRRNWITEFIGHALRRGLADDPERAFEVASESYSEWGNLDPDIAADSAFLSDMNQPA